MAIIWTCPFHGGCYWWYLSYNMGHDHFASYQIRSFFFHSSSFLRNACSQLYNVILYRRSSLSASVLVKVRFHEEMFREHLIKNCSFHRRRWYIRTSPRSLPSGHVNGLPSYPH